MSCAIEPGASRREGFQSLGIYDMSLPYGSGKQRAAG
jgi:hypothetical protein